MGVSRHLCVSGVREGGSVITECINQFEHVCVWVRK